MDKQNVTLSIPKDILRKAKILSIEQGTSLSGLMTSALTEMVNQADRYKIAKENHLTLLAKGVDLGTKGLITWTREDLHDRKS
jgi:hypothetical protein